MTTTDPTRKSEKRRRNAIVSVRMTEDELAAIEKRAAEEGKPVAAILRESALTASGSPRTVGSTAMTYGIANGISRSGTIIVKSVSRGGPPTTTNS